MNLIQVSNSRLFVHGNKFQIKACLLKENRGYAFLASNQKVPGHGMLVCLQMVQLKPQCVLHSCMHMKQHSVGISFPNKKSGQYFLKFHETLI